MNRPTNTAPQRTRLNSIASIATLAFWRWREHWFLLLVTAIGMVAAVMVVCTVPVFSQVTQIAALRGVLNATPTSSEILLHANATGLATQSVKDTYHSTSEPFLEELNSYLTGSPHFDFRTPDFPILSPKLGAFNGPMGLYGTSMQEAAAHITLLQGRLPRAQNSDFEIVITPEMAQIFHASVGSIITLNTPFFAQPAASSFARGISGSPIPLQLNLYVVGLFHVKAGDPFWHQDDFLPELAQCDGCAPHYVVLGSDQGLLSAFDAIAARYSAPEVFFATVAQSQLYWYYRLDSTRIFSIDQLADLIGRLHALQTDVATTFGDPAMVLSSPYISSVDVSGSVLSAANVPSTLEKFRSSLAAQRIPSSVLAAEITCLLLFFLSIMTTLLVDRQVTAITVMRS